jgi:dUTP pyrophosphatase
MIIVFQPLVPDVTPPEPATKGSAGYDLRAFLKNREISLAGGAVSSRAVAAPEDTLTILPGERALIPLGFKARLPERCEAQIRLRSSIALDRGLIIPNAPATIDPDYPDEWLVLVANIGTAAATLRHGERFAQAVFAHFLRPHWETGVVAVSTDRRGGAGSTGVE